MRSKENSPVVLYGSKNHDPDRIDPSEPLRNGKDKVRSKSKDLENNHHTQDHHHQEDEGGKETDKLNQSADSEAGVDKVVFTSVQNYWRKAFLISRLTLGSLNLISLCLKFPLIILIIRMAVEVAKAKAQDTSVTTIEPPYDDDAVPAANSNNEDTAAKNSQKQAFAVQILLLLVMYVGILLVHVLCVFYFWMNKGLFHLCLYLPLVGMWLFLAVPSSFVQSWSWTWTNVMFVVLQALIHGNELFGTPSQTEFRFVRISIWLDLATFILSILFIALSRRRFLGK